MCNKTAVLAETHLIVADHRVPVSRARQKLRRACAQLDSASGKKFRTDSFASFDEVNR